MPTRTLGRKYDLIDVGRADCHVHDQDHRQGRVRKVSGTFGKVRRAGGKVRRGFRKSSGGTFSSIGYTDA